MLVAISSLAVGSYGRSFERNIVAAQSGNSCSLQFDYSGPTSNVRYRFTKDGRLLRADKGRLSYRLGTIYFGRVTESDAGTYHLLVRSRGVYYSKVIVLKGNHRCTIVYSCVYIFHTIICIICCCLSSTVFPPEVPAVGSGSGHGE